ncbi:hypothetical protein SAMN02910436_01973 [Ruminococcaceae bacterium P7]|nr:hypothetical protein SAMN02910436_01973 [Ruminococcaceae bacterium P7]
MKKMLTIMISLMLCAVACLPAMAAEAEKTGASPDSAIGETDESPRTATGKTKGTATGTPIEDRIIPNTERDFFELPNTTLPLDDESKLQIAQDFKAQYQTSGDPAEYTVMLFQNLSNGMKLVFVTKPDWCYTEEYRYSLMGEYVYSRGSKEVLLYKDGTFTELFDAYHNGVIGDELLAELDTVMHFDRLAPETDDQKIDARSTEPKLTEAAAKPATRNQTTPDNTKDSAGPINDLPVNGVIATGESGALWLAIVPVLLAAVAGIYIYNRKFRH